MKPALLALGAALSIAALVPAQAAYPEKPVTVVVPFPAGGSSDAIARTLTSKLNADLGQPFVVENRPGATGAIGAAQVKRARPDGYTLLVASIGVYATNPFLQKNLPYDPAKDFDLLTVAVRAPNVLVVHPSVPSNNVKEFIEYLKQNKEKVSFASSGAGSSDHLTAAL
ncbi:MAG TPA: tripartite tricarboxylate transporter substrate binding protein, partial [Burkholderiaceae bacterium]|nr:tripartite tricarboxylate transporter substrate binding protein [Burkholderiaceae bacterium]